MDIKWIRLSTDIFDNRKIKLLDDAQIVIWLKLLVLAAQINDGGCIYLSKDIPFSMKNLSEIFKKSEKKIESSLKIFQNFGMISSENGIITITNWERYQNVDGMEKIREQTRNRVAKHRAKAKENVTESNVTETYRNAIDKNRKEKIREEEKKNIKKKEGNTDFSSLSDIFYDLMGKDTE